MKLIWNTLHKDFVTEFDASHQANETEAIGRTKSGFVAIGLLAYNEAAEKWQILHEDESLTKLRVTSYLPIAALKEIEANAKCQLFMLDAGIEFLEHYEENNSDLYAGLSFESLTLEQLHELRKKDYDFNCAILCGVCSFLSEIARAEITRIDALKGDKFLTWWENNATYIEMCELVERQQGDQKRIFAKMTIEQRTAHINSLPDIFEPDTTEQ